VDAVGFPTASAVAVTRSRAFAIDALARPRDMDAVLAALADRAPGRRRVVVNTHHHRDHVRGNAAFPTRDIVAHRTFPRLLEAHLRSISAASPSPLPHRRATAYPSPR